MEMITVGRTFDAPADRVSSTLGDVTTFFDAAGPEDGATGNRAVGTGGD